MKWYERFEYESNPFELDPFKVEYTPVKHKDHIEDMLYLVKSGSIFAIQADQGCGKSMMLKVIVDNFKGKGKVVYIDGSDLEKEVDIEEILNKKGKGLFTKRPKGMILLFDNFEKLSKTNCEKIKYYFDENYIKSVVFTTTNFKKLNISDSLKDRIMGRIIQIPELNKFEALRIIRERFSDTFFLGDETILKIFECSKKNIKQTLQNCEKICDFVVKEGRGEVLNKYVLSQLRKRKAI